VCGAGNNGGDGYACALELARLGHQVECFALAPPSTDDAKATDAAWRTSGGITHGVPNGDRDFDAVVDAMFGIGLSRPLARVFADAATWINAQRTSLRVALDVPSGLDADRGVWVGGKAGVVADVTITFLGGKPGLCTGTGCDAAGEIVIDTIGVDATTSPMNL